MSAPETNGESFPAHNENGSAAGLRSPNGKSLYKESNGWCNGFLGAADSFMQSETASSNRNTVGEWGAGSSSVEGSSGLSGLSSAWGPLGTGPGGPGSSTMSDITNKQHPQAQMSPSNPVSATLSSGVNSVANGASSVWQNSDPGDNGKNSWNSAASGAVGSAAAGGNSSQALSVKNSSAAAPFGANPNGSQGQDKENASSITLPQSTERTPLDNMIYRDGWGQVEVKQEPPWPVAETPPLQDDPSVWKPKANTGTEVWEKSTGHRTQPWQNQGPNTPHWMSDDREPNSVWSGVPSSAQMSGPMSGGPRSAGMMMPGGNGGGNGGGDGMLNNGGMSAHDRGQSGRPSWNSPGGTGSGGSGASSGGNISPTNQWSEHTNWSDWRDPTPRKSEADDGTGHWNSQSMGPRSSNGPYGGGNSSMGLSENRKMPPPPPPDQGYQQKPRGWSDSGFSGGSGSQMHQRGGSSEWNDDNEWRDPDSEKSSQWSSGGGRERPHQPPSFSPPNGPPKYTRDQIYQSKQYQNLLEMGFKREEIDIAMRNCNMNYEETVALLQQQRRRQQQMQQQQQQQQMAASNSANFGMGGDGYGKTGLTGSGSGGPGVPGNMPPHHQNNTLIQPQQPGKINPSRPTASIHAVARQLSNAAANGIIDPRLLNQPLCPQTVYHLHKLMQMHRQLTQLGAQLELVTAQKGVNPIMQNQQVTHLQMQMHMLKDEIGIVKKQIDRIQNEYLKAPMDPRFQGGPTLVDLAASMRVGGMDFHSPAAAATGASNYGQSGWRMPEPSPYGGMGGGGGDSSWSGGSGSFAGTGSAFNNNSNMAAGNAPMWNDPQNWNAGMNQGGMNWRPAMPGGGGGHGMDDWSGGMHGAGHMKMSSSGAGNSGQHGQSASGDRGSLSPTSRTGATGNGAGYGMDEADGSWGNRQLDASSFSNFSSRVTWDALPEFEPGKPWRGSQMSSADEDPHLTPGSVAKSPLMNAVTSGGGNHFNSSD